MTASDDSFPLPAEPPEEPDGEPHGAEPAEHRLLAAGSFILDASAIPPAWWGKGAEVLGAEGEALLIAGPQGLGKSTLAQQLALGRAGFAEYASLLGYPVKPGSRRTLYLAMDRPRQIARSMRRMVGESWRDELNERLAVWVGPPPLDLAKNPVALRSLCRSADADTVVIDSLKDAAIGLSDDDVGAGWNRARQMVITDGVEVIELHHQRKVPNGQKREKPSIDDVYGSTWLTSGVGSVIVLTGEPGDPVIGFHHVKQPLDEIGPLKVIHDRESGRSAVYESADLLKLVGAQGGQITALLAASLLFDKDKPSANDKEKARRRLKSLVDAGQLVVREEGDTATKRPTVWGLPG